MISREDAIFTIGYDGNKAIVDGLAKKKYGKLSTRELAEKGFFRAAYCSAIYSKDPAEMKTFIEVYSRITGTQYPDDYSFNRLFGVFPVEVEQVMVL